MTRRCTPSWNKQSLRRQSGTSLYVTLVRRLRGTGQKTPPDPVSKHLRDSLRTASHRTRERAILGTFGLTRSRPSAAASVRPESIVMMAYKCQNRRRQSAEVS